MTVENAYCLIPEVHGERCRCRKSLPEIDNRPHLVPCVCTRDYHSGRVVDYDCGRTVQAVEAVDMVNHPPHYNSHPSRVQAIEISRHLTFDVGNAFKYVFRAPFKGTEQQDLDKARWYVKDAIGHADRIFLPTYTFRADQLLDHVSKYETEHNRWAFMRGLKAGNLDQCLISVNALLAAF